MTFTDDDHCMEMLRKLMPFPPNLKLPSGEFEKNRLVDLLVDHYEIEKSPLEIDFDLTMSRDFRGKPDIQEFYEGIFSSIDLIGKVMMYPWYLDSGAVGVVFDAADLYTFLMEESYNLTKRYELVDIARQDVVFIFLDQSLIVSIDHTADSYIARINRKIAPGTDFLRPTLLWSKVWLWSVLCFEEWIYLEKGTYLLRYDPSYSPEELSALSIVVNELLGFYPEDPLGKKHPVIVENVSLQTCVRFRDLLNNSGINVLIEERSEFKNVICLRMARNQPDIIEE